MLDRRQALLAPLALGTAAGLSAQTAPPSVPGGHPFRLPDPTEMIDLWPNGAPGMPASPPVEIVEDRSTDPQAPDRSVRGISRPRLAVFRPASANGSAALVMPGGGYQRIVIDREGYELGRWLAARGWTAFVLFYRLPGEGWKSGPDVALADAQRAMRIIRAQSHEVRPGRVAAIGFSAGGHLCGDLATRFATDTYAPIDAADRLSARPDIAAPIYAVQSMRLPLAHAGSRALLIGADASPALEAAHSTARNVSAGTPPCFLVHAEDDTTVNVENSLEFRAALKGAGVPVETHLFAQGGHGFGIGGAAGKPAAEWPALFAAWARSQGLGG